MEAKPTETKICPLCTEPINSRAVICPKCGSVIGGWKAQIHLFIKFRILIIILGTLATLVAGFFINKWISQGAITAPPDQLAVAASAPALVTATPIAPAVLVVPEVKNRLDYAYKIEKGKKVRTGLFGLGKKTDIYYLRLTVTNHGNLKLNKVRINLDLSNAIASHNLPFQYDILDDTGVKITDLSKHFAGRTKAVMVIPFCLPEQNISLWLAFKGEARVNHIDVYSEELKGAQVDFLK